MGVSEVLRILHEYYGWEVVKLLPLSIISKMILNAKKKEAEKLIYPMWLVHVLKATIEKTEVVPIEDFLNFDENTKTTTRSAEEILRDITPLVEKYRKGGETDG